MSSIDQSADIQSVGDAAAFSVGGVIGKSLSIFGRHFWPFIAVTAVGMMPYLILLLVDPDYVAAMNSPSRSAAQGGILNAFLPLLTSFLQAITQAVIFGAAFADLSGQPVDIGVSVRRGLSRFFPLIGIQILVGFGEVIGLVLLVVPGLIVFTMWALADSVCVLEGLGPVKSVNRSAALTRGHRWKVFGIMLILTLGVALGEMIILAVLPLAGLTAWAIVSYLFQVVSMPLSALIGVTVYYDLRAAKEGLGIARISAVFD